MVDALLAIDVFSTWRPEKIKCMETEPVTEVYERRSRVEGPSSRPTFVAHGSSPESHPQWGDVEAQEMCASTVHVRSGHDVRNEHCAYGRNACVV